MELYSLGTGDKAITDGLWCSVLRLLCLSGDLLYLGPGLIISSKPSTQENWRRSPWAPRMLIAPNCSSAHCLLITKGSVAPPERNFLSGTLLNVTEEAPRAKKEPITTIVDNFLILDYSPDRRGLA